MAQFFVDEQPVTYAAVDPKTFWRYTVPGTAHTADVWQRVAGGEIAVQPADRPASCRPRTATSSSATAADAPSAHVGAYAQLLDAGYARQIDAVVNYQVGQAAGDDARQRRADLDGRHRRRSRS